ncbi:50S ribosomal protein L24 [Patescibacteria group bacterium]|nr:50S ribosomal protein L24 [Patescibacteria group bacterium]MBU2259734.1 50S ribosomal protein L24 [Patescibacteria group bacterium]
MKLHTGDQVVVITGKDKGKTGKVLRVLESADRIVVSDVNMRTKHLRKQPNRQGQIIRYEASLQISNVMLVDSKTKKRTRIGFVVDEKGKKKRIAKKSGEAVTMVKGDTKKIKGDKVIREETKETKESKEMKQSKKKNERVEAPGKQPFWKGLGFGAEAMEEADVKESSHMKEDRTVPDQGKTPDTFTHQRGS